MASRMPAEQPAPLPESRRADAERNVLRIQEAAIRLWADEPNAGVADVAAAAGVGRATLYRHFPTRESLLEAIRSQGMTDGEQRDGGLPPRGGLADRRRWSGCWRAWLELGDRYRVVIANPSAPDNYAARAREEAMGEALQRVIVRGPGRRGVLARRARTVGLDRARVAARGHDPGRRRGPDRARGRAPAAGPLGRWARCSPGVIRRAASAVPLGADCRRPLQQRPAGPRSPCPDRRRARGRARRARVRLGRRAPVERLRLPEPAAFLLESLADLDERCASVAPGWWCAAATWSREAVALAREVGARAIFTSADVSAYAQRGAAAAPRVHERADRAARLPGRDDRAARRPHARGRRPLPRLHPLLATLARGALRAPCTAHRARLALPAGLERGAVPALRAHGRRDVPEPAHRGRARRRAAPVGLGAIAGSVATASATTTSPAMRRRGSAPTCASAACRRARWWSECSGAAGRGALRAAALLARLLPARHGRATPPAALRTTAARAAAGTATTRLGGVEGGDAPAIRSWTRACGSSPEGWMHNRARLVTARSSSRTWAPTGALGAAHFWELLVDGEIANNAGNWQWVAGTGNDTRPNRVLNPLRAGAPLRPERGLRAPLRARARGNRRPRPCTSRGSCRRARRRSTTRSRSWTASRREFRSVARSGSPLGGCHAPHRTPSDEQQRARKRQKDAAAESATRRALAPHAGLTRRGRVHRPSRVAEREQRDRRRHDQAEHDAEDRLVEDELADARVAVVEQRARPRRRRAEAPPGRAGRSDAPGAAGSAAARRRRIPAVRQPREAPLAHLLPDDRGDREGGEERQHEAGRDRVDQHARAADERHRRRAAPRPRRA